MYSTSFTSARLMIHESKLIATIKLQVLDWDIVQEDVLSHNKLNRSSDYTSHRVFKELKKRLSCLSEAELQFLVNTDHNSAKAMCFLACLRAYSFILEFCTEVILNKREELKTHLSDKDFNEFYEQVALVDSELASKKESSRYKVKQVLFRILEDAEWIDNMKNKMLQVPFVSMDVRQFIMNEPKIIHKCFGL